MKALVLIARDAPFSLQDVPDPVAGPGKAVARVLACGSGLTIQHVKAGRSAVTYPRIIGHEITGEIVEVGTGVTEVARGDAVTAHYYLFCGHCRMCVGNVEPLCEHPRGNVGRDCDGGYAEYVKLPARNFIRLPPGLDHRKHPAEIGVISDALATPYKVNRRTRTACSPAADDHREFPELFWGVRASMRVGNAMAAVPVRRGGAGGRATLTCCAQVGERRGVNRLSRISIPSRSTLSQRRASSENR